MNLSNLEYAAVKFFDIFDHPLTLEEVKKYAYRGVDFKVPPIMESGGFLVHPGREGIIAMRKDKEKIAERKDKRARLAAWVFGILPWIRMIAVCNSLGFRGSKDESDIDLFIITKSGYLWLTRLILASLLEIFGLRSGIKAVRDQICLTFFIDESALNISDLALRDDLENIDDPYLVYWIWTLRPILNRRNTYECFLNANKWTKEFLLNIEIPTSPVIARSKATKRSLVINNLESLAKRFQNKRMNPSIIERSLKLDTAVVISDSVLKFHVNDRRKEFREKFLGNSAAR